MENEKKRKGTAEQKPQCGRKAPGAKPAGGRHAKGSGTERRRANDPNEPLSAAGHIRFILEPYVDAIRRLYECSCREKLRFNLDVGERRWDDGALTVKAALLTSRDEADARQFRDGKVTERKWHNVFRKERRMTDKETLDVAEFCTSFIEWCTFLFTDRKALVRELNVGRQRKFPWSLLP